MDSDSQARLTSNPLRILDSKNKETQLLLNEAPTLLQALSAESVARFEKVRALLHQLQIPHQINPRLVRGLDYYGHTAFEMTSDQLGAQATVCGGDAMTDWFSSWVVQSRPRLAGPWEWSVFYW